MKLAIFIAWLAAALATAAVASASDQAYISWRLGDQDGHPRSRGRSRARRSGTWAPSRSPPTAASRPAATSCRRTWSRTRCSSRTRAPGLWVGPQALQPGHVLRSPATPLRRSVQRKLPVRHVGTVVQNRPTSAAGASLEGKGRCRPRDRLVDQAAQRLVREHGCSGRQPCLLEPGGCCRLAQGADEDALASTLLSRDRYHVRLRVRHARCESCVWTSSAKIVDVKRANSPPTLKPARFELARRDAKTHRHTSKATFVACDRTRGALRLQIREETGRIGR